MFAKYKSWGIEYRHMMGAENLFYVVYNEQLFKIFLMKIFNL